MRKDEGNNVILPTQEWEAGYSPELMWVVKEKHKVKITVFEEYGNIKESERNSWYILLK